MNALAPWNWFKREDAGGDRLPVRRPARGSGMLSPMDEFRMSFDSLFDDFFRPYTFGGSLNGRDRLSLANDIQLKPTLDIDATDDAYTISVELPGVERDDVSLELMDDTIVIRGEKRHVKEEKGTSYCIERSYGSFLRQLSLPGDVDADQVEARFKNGVMTIRLPRSEVARPRLKEIEVQTGS